LHLCHLGCSCVYLRLLNEIEWMNEWTNITHFGQVLYTRCYIHLLLSLRNCLAGRCVQHCNTSFCAEIAVFKTFKCRLFSENGNKMHTEGIGKQALHRYLVRWIRLLSTTSQIYNARKVTPKSESMHSDYYMYVIDLSLHMAEWLNA